MISFRTIYRTSFMSYLRYNDFHRIWLNFSLNDLWCLLISVSDSMWSTKWLILVSWFYKNLKVCIRFESTLIFQCSYDSFWYFHRKSCKDHFCFSYSCCSTEHQCRNCEWLYDVILTFVTISKCITENENQNSN